VREGREVFEGKVAAAGRGVDWRGVEWLRR
jgi:hypothetical protein